MTITWQDILVHLALVPLYLWLGIVRHEMSHGFVFVAQGIGVSDVVCWPHWYRWAWDPLAQDWEYQFSYWPVRLAPDIRDFCYGRCLAERWRERPQDKRSTRIRSLAPYISCLLCAGLGFWLVPMAFETQNIHWVTVTVVMLWLSPVIDTTVNIFTWLVYKRGDWEEAFPHG